MKKTLLSALKHGSGTIFILLSMMLGGGLQAWGGEYTLYFVRPSVWSNTPNIHIWYGTDTKIVDNQQMSLNSSNVYSYTFSTEQTSISVMFNNSSWDHKSNNNFTSWTPVSGTYFTCNGDNTDVTLVKDFSAGDYIYFVNGKDNKDKNGANIGSEWIYSNGDSEIGYAEIVLTDISGTTYTYDFSRYSGIAYEVGAVYRAQVASTFKCKSFKLTRGNSVGSKSPWNETGDMTFDAAKIDYNTITKITGSSGASWTGNYTSYCNAPTPSTGSASSITATTVTLGATVAAAASNPCTPTYVGVKVYSDASCETLVTSGQTAFTNYAATYSIGITDIDPITTYYFKAYAISDAGTTEASTASNFTTACRTGVTTTNPSTSTQSACLGSATALSVTAGGLSGTPTYTYQWYYNTTASTTGAVAIPGATSSNYTPAVVGEDYYYYCGVAAEGGYCEVASGFSGQTTIYAKPTLSVSQSSVTNYVPVTVTSQGAEIKSGGWSFTVDSGKSTKAYFYNEGSKSAKFKALTGSSATYTITGTTSNNCSGTATVTVTSDSQDCH